MKKIKGKICQNDDCKEKAKYECEDCGHLVCKICAENQDYGCDECFQEPPRLIKIKRKK